MEFSQNCDWKRWKIVDTFASFTKPTSKKFIKFNRERD